MHIPELLLCIPVAQVNAKYVSADNKLHITMTEAVNELNRYKQAVEQFLNDRYCTRQEEQRKQKEEEEEEEQQQQQNAYTVATEIIEEITEAIRFALCLFNAENFTGELSLAERKELKLLLHRFEHLGMLNSRKIEIESTNVEKQHEQEELEESEEQQEEEQQQQLEEEEQCKKQQGLNSVDKAFYSSSAKSINDKYCERLLMTDGEAATPCIRLPALLLCIRAIISAHCACYNSNNTSSNINYDNIAVRSIAQEEQVAERLQVQEAADENDEPERKFVKHDPVYDDARLFVPLHNIWRVRVLFRHQLCLLHRSHSLYTELFKSIAAILNETNQYHVALQAGDFAIGASNMAALQRRTEVATYLIEIGHIQNYYHKRDAAAQSFHRAMQVTGLRLRERAIMGVRTRWQQQQYVQMILEAESQLPLLLPPQHSSYLTGTLKNVHDSDEMSVVSCEPQPEIILSEKDGHDLLDVPRAAPETAPTPLLPLHPLDKAIILAMCHNIRNTNPTHGLTAHHMQTYVERLLAPEQSLTSNTLFCNDKDTNSNNNSSSSSNSRNEERNAIFAQTPFVISSQILLLRTRLERHRNRVQERAFMQLTELIEQYETRRQPTLLMLPRTQNRFFYTVAYPSIWELRNEYAEFCFDETLYKTALENYEQTQNWSKIIECCKKLDKRKRAESLARALLEDDPDNPLLYVALGEATRQDEYLWHAWELGEHQLAAPMRALARIALEREQYRNVMTYFDNAVAINPLFGGDWFSLGYAALKLSEFQRGCEAFTRVCQIDPNDAFAWNNLASLLMRSSQIRPAFNAMSQALRHNRRDWRMWVNYFEMAVQLREVTEATHALRIAVEIAKRHLQLETLNLREFVSLTLLYLQHKIPGSTRDVCEDELIEIVSNTNNNNNNNNSNNNNSEKEGEIENESKMHIPHVPLAENDEYLDEEMNRKEMKQSEMEEEFAELVPFGADIDYNDHTRYTNDSNSNNNNNNNEQEEEEEEEEREREHIRVENEIRQRHGVRVKELFHDLCELFVTIPDLYNAAAELYTFFDGPLKGGYEYHLKELRACRHKEQWERDATKFARTVQALRSLVSSVLSALELMKKKNDAAMFPAANATISSNACNTANNINDINFSESDLLTALKDTQNNIKATLEISQEHMESTNEYGQLRVLSAKVRAAIQEAKSTFV